MQRALAALGVAVDVVDTQSKPGGGTLPTVTVPSVALRVAHADVDGLGAQLRRFDPPVVTRVADGALWVDLRTVFSDEDAAVQRALAWAMRGGGTDVEDGRRSGATQAGEAVGVGMDRMLDSASREDGPC